VLELGLCPEFLFSWIGSCYSLCVCRECYSCRKSNLLIGNVGNWGTEMESDWSGPPISQQQELSYLR
jgi:hypothetical protein